MTLTTFILRRILALLVLLLVVSLLVFVGTELLPGDVAQVALGSFASPENVEALRRELGLDQPAILRYLDWLGGVVLHGDWGISIVSRQPVTVMLSERVRNTAILAGATAVIAIPLSIALGIVMAVFHGRRLDRILSVVVLTLSATPEFLLGALAVLLLSLQFDLLPSVSYLGSGATIKALVMPVGVLVLVMTAQIARMTRATLVNVLSYPYIEMALLKGVPVWRVVTLHALPNAIGPIVNIIALNVAYLVSGIVVVETVFSYPGIARLMIDAVQSRDFPVIQACALIFCASYVLLILLADVISHIADPRARASSH
ncbi:ABC transporter permease [Ochrobactrum sp. CM-21-5]|nr:ABC transporter permease [Ochrobactrum sp. CM-21-5]